MKDFDQPYLSGDLPAVGGKIKAEAAHFVVEELPLYEASGQGPHLYLTLRRTGLTTRQVVDELSRRFKQPAGAIGYAGLKDKWAVTTQTFSLPVALGEAEVLSLCEGAPWEMVAVSRHQNKLKVGHLLGNRFTVVLSGPTGSLAEAQAIIDRLLETGLPNYFGEQRFGEAGDNPEEALKLLQKDQKARGWRDKFLMSALQSFIFNYYLSLRIKRGLFQKILTGDICKKYATGGLFTSEDGQVETERLKVGELTFTGPLFGSKVMRAKGEAGELESEALAGLGLSEEEAARTGVGDRRAGRLLIPDLAVFEHDAGLVFTFALPKGAYATTVMREFMRG